MPLRASRCLASCSMQVFGLMGCCFGKSDDDMPPAFDPVIGLSDKLKGPGVMVNGLAISGTGSIFGDSPVLQDKAYFEVTVLKAGTFAVGVAARETALDVVVSQEKVRARIGWPRAIPSLT